jgi:hypothetical protein
VTRDHRLHHEFVEQIPPSLDKGTVYVSIKYATVAHLCCCGCRHEVVTPLGPTDWRLIFDGETVSLTPSIGNWSFPCRSHYWIRNDRVEWAPSMSEAQISAGRSRDRVAKDRYFETPAAPREQGASSARVSRIRRWLQRWRHRGHRDEH